MALIAPMPPIANSQQPIVNSQLLVLAVEDWLGVHLEELRA